MPASDLVRRWWLSFWEDNKHSPDKFISYAYQALGEAQEKIKYEEGFIGGHYKVKIDIIEKLLPIAEERKLELEAYAKHPRRIFLTGDIHGETDISTLNTKNFPEQKELTKHDLLIVLGDFGLVWDVNESKPQEKHWVDWLSTRNFTTVVVLGNHENYDRIFELPEVEMFENKVWKYTDSIFILQRGRVYRINGKLFFTMGGAESIDKNVRKNHISWWKEEIPSVEEFDRGLTDLYVCDNKVDYVLTHTAPKTVINQYMKTLRDNYFKEFGSPEGMYDRIADEYVDTDYFTARKDAVSDYLEEVFFNSYLHFKKHFFGHFHDNWITENGKHQMIYRQVIELETE